MHTTRSVNTIQVRASHHLPNSLPCNLSDTPGSCSIYLSYGYLGVGLFAKDLSCQQVINHAGHLPNACFSTFSSNVLPKPPSIKQHHLCRSLHQGHSCFHSHCHPRFHSWETMIFHPILISRVIDTILVDFLSSRPTQESMSHSCRRG